MYYDRDDGLPEDCDQIILFEALLELHFPRHSVQRFNHMFDCHNLYHANASSKAKTTICTSVMQKSHIDYCQLLSSILNLSGKSNRESVFDKLPFSFVVGIDDGVSLCIHESVNDALLNDESTKVLFSLKGKAFDEKYPMKSVVIPPGHALIFAGTTCCF